MKKLIVIGGGASGLMAAIQAARAGAGVTILEHQSACGKKLLATGNGRCNLTNTRICPDAYHSHAPGTVAEVLRRFTVADTLDFFSGLGLLTRDKNGWIYPYSQQARTVLHLLLSEAARLGVKIQTQTAIQNIRKTQTGRWMLRTDAKTYGADAVILAAGSKASNLPGADGSGYDLAKSLGHKIYPVLPALVPLIGEGDYFKQWAGLRMEAVVSVLLNGKEVKKERGEVQLTDRGVSGIPVFQVSRYAVEGISQGKRAQIVLDLFPDAGARKLEELLRNRKRQSPYKDWTEILLGIFPEKFCKIAARRIKGTKESIPRHLARELKHWSVPIKGAQDYIYAQVCMGGVDLRQVDPRTLESRLYEGLYFAGEILDVDGACGGYNLQWAWSSGAVAAQAACEKRREEGQS